LSLGLKQLAKTVTKYFKKRTDPNIDTNKLLALNISFTSYYSKFTTLLRVIHNIITNSILIQPNNTGTMAPRRPIQPQISIEWAESLVGLSMKMPDHWWERYNGSNLNDGKIVSFDVVNQKWNLLLDDQDDDDDEYLMAYEAVCEYCNKQHSTFN
jgi:hypothetical protein